MPSVGEIRPHEVQRLTRIREFLLKNEPFSALHEIDVIIGRASCTDFAQTCVDEAVEFATGKRPCQACRSKACT